MEEKKHSGFVYVGVENVGLHSVTSFKQSAPSGIAAFRCYVQLRSLNIRPRLARVCLTAAKHNTTRPCRAAVSYTLNCKCMSENLSGTFHRAAFHTRPGMHSRLCKAHSVSSPLMAAIKSALTPFPRRFAASSQGPVFISAAKVATT